MNMASAFEITQPLKTAKAGAASFAVLQTEKGWASLHRETSRLSPSSSDLFVGLVFVAQSVGIGKRPVCPRVPSEFPSSLIYAAVTPLLSAAW